MLKSMIDTKVRYLKTDVKRFESKIKKILIMVLENVSGEDINKNLLEEHINSYQLKDIVIKIILKHFNHNCLILNSSL